jgi:UDP-N-acetylmuramate--alanine ligase
MFSFDIHSHIYKHVHFIGIGGISMSGLAEILLSNGYKVSGSDMKDSPIIDKLRRKGAVVYIGHNENNIKGADLVVYTSAISYDNPEFQKAKESGIITVDRATFLGQLMKSYNNSIAVAGTHGKTTTTGMISIVLNNSEISPTILLGGELDQIGGNVKIGNGDCLLTEACEYKGNFLKFFPTIGIILNIEEDHLDYFKDITHIIDTFSNFAGLIPREGTLVINSDDKYSKKVIDKAKCKVVTFGVKNNADFTAKDIAFTDEGYPQFTLLIYNEKEFKVTLNVMGIHNVYNALAAIAASYHLGIPIDIIIKSIESYTGTHRRFEEKGAINGIKVIDDYAHHPTEIKATLGTARRIAKNKLWCIFQPHTYTRTKALLNEFGISFNEADKVIVTDIYAAREKDTGLIHSKHLVENLLENNVDAQYISSFEEIAYYVSENVNSGDVIITVGAGDVFLIGELILDKLENKNKEIFFSDSRKTVNI